MIITCPNCQTRYRVGSDALSAAGRQVQCAACAQLWHATPSLPQASPSRPDPEPGDDELIFRADPDTVFTPADEEMLDRLFIASDTGAFTLENTGAMPETKGIPAQSAPSHPDARARTEALAKRRRGMIAALPMARIRRVVRVIIAALLISTVVCALVFRTEIVRAIPQADSLYRLVGLGTNVVGLDFTDVKTLGTTRDGNSVLIVTAKISNITNHVAYVPSVLVSLMNPDGQVLYEWTVTPATRTILPGDILEIDAQLTGPPEGVATVRLSFVESPGRTAN